MTYIILLTISVVLVAVAFAIQDIREDKRNHDKLFNNEWREKWKMMKY